MIIENRRMNSASEKTIVCGYRILSILFVFILLSCAQIHDNDYQSIGSDDVTIEFQQLGKTGVKLTASNKSNKTATIPASILCHDYAYRLSFFDDNGKFLAFAFSECKTSLREMKYVLVPSISSAAFTLQFPEDLNIPLRAHTLQLSLISKEYFADDLEQKMPNSNLWLGVASTAKVSVTQLK